MNNGMKVWMAGWKRMPVVCVNEFFGPLLDDGLKGGTPKALKGLPLSLLFCLSVCVCVCLSVTKLQTTVFDPAT